ncbi:MAG: glycosyltransferase family 87 protein [bacterium]|nr:glycosyltransferase family 87 protein [bacterium]
MKRRFLRGAAAAGLALYCAALVADVADIRSGYQWDFLTYYYAARASAAGISPYDDASLSRLAHEPIQVKYIFLPLTLAPFRPLTALDYPTAYRGYLLLKCAAFVALLLLWKRRFVGAGDGILFVAFCLFAFNGAAYADIKAGNISMLETLLLWAGFACLIAGRTPAFCLCVVAAATYKITPILFLALLPFSEDRRRWRWMAGSIALFAGYLLLNRLIAPAGVTDFLRDAAELTEKGGILSPSTYWLAGDACRMAAVHGGLAVPAYAHQALYAAAALAVIALSWRACAALRPRADREAATDAVCIACLAYALALPRFKDYSYVLLILPAYLAVRRWCHAPAFVLMLLACVVPSPATRTYYVMPGWGAVFHRLVWPYYPLLVAFGVWLLYLDGAARGRRRAGDGTGCTARRREGTPPPRVTERCRTGTSPGRGC